MGMPLTMLYEWLAVVAAYAVVVIVAWAYRHPDANPPHHNGGKS